MANIAISVLRDNKKQTGIGHHISHLVSALQEIDNQNKYILYICRDVYDIYEIPKGATNFRKVKVEIDAKSSILKMLWTLFYLPIQLRKDNIDLIHFPAFTFFIYMGKPIVLTLHDIAEFTMSTKRYDILRVFFRKLTHPIVVRIANKILTVSQYTKNEIIKYLKVDDEKIDITYNGVSKNFFIMDRIDCEKILNKRYCIDGPFLLYVSRLQHPSKNHVRLLQAFSKLKEEKIIEHKLVFIGPSTKGDQEIFKAIHELNLDDDVVYLGYVSDNDMPLFYNGAELYVCPSLFEGFGMPIIEAMACGTPVVSSNASSLPEVVGDAGLLFDPYDVEDMKSKIHTLLVDSDRRKIFIEMGLVRSKEFRWLQTAQKTLSVYQSLM